ncbi:hypothetical protein AB0F91_07400 [Amycolatopsis sp. NPDC023774]|uniref:hypothetical protein n=1 Tax=Amycolatopsis sp. NPDC023774 TaxID=3155015 RepID=UPI0033E174D5
MRGYARKLWIAGEDALTEAIAEADELPATDMAARAPARYVPEIPDLTGTSPTPSPR